MPAPGDPNADGPFGVTEVDSKPTLKTGDVEAIHCAFPSPGSSSAPYPFVLLAHGFLGNNAVMAPFEKRLASFGYVACAADYPSGFSGSDNPKQAAILSAAIDWALLQSASAGNALSGLIDPDRIGTTGHSLGGKLSLLVAQTDTRVRASIVLDPVDAGGPNGCSPPACVDVSAAMGSLAIPTGFLGETIDATSAGFQACAPEADNYATFYAGAQSPSLSVTVVGANHVSFIGMGAPGFCNKATASASDVLALSLAYVTAFYERHLRGLESYDAYLTGADAKARYINPGKVTIAAK
jgi:dienelactone hydrolase